MFAIDAMFLATVQANLHLRPRIGNPDEMRSNRMIQTLENLKFRVTDPELDIPEDIHGNVITALNEEAVASAALANKGGINFIHTSGRFRFPRTERESMHLASASLQADLYPDSVPERIFVTHTRPEPLLGTLQPFNTGSKRTIALGFINQGGILNVPGMLFVNRCTWAHIILETAHVLDMPEKEVLTSEEISALSGKASPEGVIF